MNHYYKANVEWIGNTGAGTANVKSYLRDHTIEVKGKPVIPGTSEVSIAANKVHYNPEELLVASVSACHMMWFLFLCAKAGVIIDAYTDEPVGTMVSNDDGGGAFTNITLHPNISISGTIDHGLMKELHTEAHRLCYIANSCNFQIDCEAKYIGTNDSLN